MTGSDGNEFLPGTFFAYKTNQGRYGKFIVEALGETNSKTLTLGWVSYADASTVYSEGHGLEIPGSWSCDLDEGGLVDDNQADWWWSLSTDTIRHRFINSCRKNPVHTAPPILRKKFRTVGIAA